MGSLPNPTGTPAPSMRNIFRDSNMKEMGFAKLDTARMFLSDCGFACGCVLRSFHRRAIRGEAQEMISSVQQINLKLLLVRVCYIVRPEYLFLLYLERHCEFPLCESMKQEGLRKRRPTAEKC